MDKTMEQNISDTAFVTRIIARTIATMTEIRGEPTKNNKHIKFLNENTPVEFQCSNSKCKYDESLVLGGTCMGDCDGKKREVGVGWRIVELCEATYE